MQIYSTDHKPVTGACSLSLGDLRISISNVHPGGEVAVFRVGDRFLKSWSGASAENVARAIAYAKRQNAKGG